MAHVRRDRRRPDGRHQRGSRDHTASPSATTRSSCSCPKSTADAMRMVDLAAALHLSPSGLTRRLDGLTRHGLRRPRPVAPGPAGHARRAHRQRLRQAPRGLSRRTSPASAGASSTPARAADVAALGRIFAAIQKGLCDVMTALPRGFAAYVANLGVKDDRDDFVVIAADRPVAAAGVFTRSRFAGAVRRRQPRAPRRPTAQAVVVVSRNANVANGRAGDRGQPGRDGSRRRAPRLRGRRRARRVDRRDRPALPDRADARGHRLDAGASPGRVDRPRCGGDDDDRHPRRRSPSGRSPAATPGSSAWPRAPG